jgi:hypothetical protein
MDGACHHNTLTVPAPPRLPAAADVVDAALLDEVAAVVAALLLDADVVAPPPVLGAVVGLAAVVAVGAGTVAAADAPQAASNAPRLPVVRPSATPRTSACRRVSRPARAAASSSSNVDAVY